MKFKQNNKEKSSCWEPCKTKIIDLLNKNYDKIKYQYEKKLVTKMIKLGILFIVGLKDIDPTLIEKKLT